MAASHRAREYGDILRIQQVIDCELECAAGLAQQELALQHHIVHIIGLEATRDVLHLVAGGRIALAVAVPLVGEAPRAPFGAGIDVGGMQRVARI